MKAIITVIDDNGEVICKDYVLGPVRENIVGTSDQFPIWETSFSFVIRQLADSQNKVIEDE